MRALDFIRNKTPARLDAVIQQDDGSGVTLQDVYAEPVDSTKEYVDEFLSTLEKNERFITRMLMDGEPQRVIGEILGITQVQVSRTKLKIKEKYQLFKENDVEIK